jgi:hypothetical protein
MINVYQNSVSVLGAVEQQPINLTLYQNSIYVLGAVEQQPINLNLYQNSIYVLGTDYVPPFNENFTPSGSLILSGDSIVKQNYNNYSSGSLTLSGDSICSLYTPSFDESYTSSGSLILSGNSLCISSFDESYTSSGSLILSGDSIVKQNYNNYSSGSLILSGDSICSLYTPSFDESYISFGSLILSGDSLSRFSVKNQEVLYLNLFNNSVVNNNFIVNLDFSWNITVLIDFDLQFKWDIGDQSLNWYTIEGLCIKNKGCKTTGIPADSDGSIYTRIVAAKNVSDLCYKLNSLYLNYPVDWPIIRILRSKKPVYTTDVDYNPSNYIVKKLDNNSIVKDNGVTFNGYNTSFEYSDSFTSILPDGTQVVRVFDNGILKKVQIINSFGTKNYYENTVAVLRAIPSSLITTNYDIVQQLSNLSVNDNSLEEVEYCHIPECLNFCIDYDFTINIGVSTKFSDSFYNYVSDGNLNLIGYVESDLSKEVVGGTLIFTGSSDAYKNFYVIESNGGFILEGVSDVISDNLNYESNGVIVFAGTSEVQSTSYWIKSIGSLNLIGDSSNKLSLIHNVKSGKLIIAGQSLFDKNLKFYYESNSGLYLNSSSESFIKHRYYDSGGVLNLNNSSNLSSTTWLFTPSGSIELYGNYKPHYKSYSSGGLLIGSSSNNLFNLFNNVTGQILLSGNTIVNESTAYSYKSSGFFTLSDTSNINLINDLNLQVEIGVTSYLSSYEAVLPEVYDNTADNLSSSVEYVNNQSCGCNPIPSKLYLNHNLNDLSLFNLFLNRSNLSLDKIVSLVYSTNAGWQNSFYYKNNFESWKLTCEWNCVLFNNANTWKFSLLFNRKNNISNLNTKLIYNFESLDPCNNDLIDFSFNINTNTKNLVYPSGVNLVSSLIKDDIGLFKDPEWINKNKYLLKFKISPTNTIKSLSKKDIFSIFP